ncbi:MAG: sulfite exporter TauE/SafE family protein [Dehalococcoidales bacterium]|nr:sulfite exporter TauE/SafE family protein [Dehalococcoidales bacterium]
MLAFGYGLASVLSPCILPLLPVYIASLVGPEIFDADAKKSRLSIFLHSLSFVIGFTVVFTLWGAGSGFLGSILVEHLPVIRKVAGILLIIFGLVMLAATKIPWLNYEKRLNLSLPIANGYLRSLLVGMIFPIAWIPCTSPVLAGILLLAGTSQTAWQGAGLLAIYSLGLGLPFLILGAAFGFITPVLKVINRYSIWVYFISGLLLLAVGILVLADKLAWLQGRI